MFGNNGSKIRNTIRVIRATAWVPGPALEKNDTTNFVIYVNFPLVLNNRKALGLLTTPAHRPQEIFGKRQRVSTNAYMKDAGRKAALTRGDMSPENSSKNG